MKRKDRQLSDPAAIEAIIGESQVCRLAMTDGDEPYVVPLCFGYHENALYFHGAPEGKKIELLRKNPRVCFEFDRIVEMVEAENACGWSMKYRSVIGFGKAVLIEDEDEKRAALNIIMGQYSDGTFEFPDRAVEKTAVIKVEIETMSGKGTDPSMP